MSEHPALEPTGTVHRCTGGPSGDADTTAAFTDLVCADHELLRAEFDAIIAANFPDHAADHPQRRDPTVPVSTGTRVPPWPAATPRRHRPGPDGVTRVVLRLRARQRGPPPSRGDTLPRPDRR